MDTTVSFHLQLATRRCQMRTGHEENLQVARAGRNLRNNTTSDYPPFLPGITPELTLVRV
eukprot:2803028-Prymnesium_polylepis.1